MFRLVRKQNEVTTDDITMFCTQVAMVLKAGIPLYDGIHAIYEDLTEEPFKSVVKKVDDEMAKNAPLHKAMEAAQAFPRYAVNMVEIAEYAGKLEEVMNALADYYQREKLVKMRIKSAVIYPLTLFCMMTVVVALLVIKVLPMFSDIMTELGGELSAGAAALMNIGLTVGSWSFVLLVIIIIAAIVLYAYSRSERGSAAMGSFWEGFPLTRGIYRSIAAGRFSSAMALMLSSGVDTAQALEMSASLVENRYVSQKILQCNELIEQGKSFSQALAEADVFPQLFTRFLSIGFKTGAMDSVMAKIANLYDEKIDTSIGNVTALIEPVLVAILAVIVGAILLSVLLPLTGIMMSIG